MKNLVKALHKSDKRWKYRIELDESNHWFKDA